MLLHEEQYTQYQKQDFMQIQNSIISLSLFAVLRYCAPFEVILILFFLSMVMRPFLCKRSRYFFSWE